MPAELHIISGSTGAGKTTYAMALAKRHGALHLSIDEWMTTLFAQDQTETADFNWMMDRVLRCEVQMWGLVEQMSGLDLPVVADCGFTRAEHRARWWEKAEAAGIPVRLHHIDADPEERWRRVQRRNVERGDTFRLNVSREMFDFVEGLWEPPTAEEMVMMNGYKALA